MKKLYILLIMITHTFISLPYTITIITGSQLRDYIPFMAQQRLEYFQGYPYLYKGSGELEQEYLEWFCSLPLSVAAIAYENETPVGFLTGVALSDFDAHFKESIKHFEAAGLNPYAYYYMAECIVLPEHRGKRLSQKLLQALELHAYQQGYHAYCFATEIHTTHPLEPSNYDHMHDYCYQLGYHPSEITITFDWPTIQRDGTIVQQDHLLTYWLKSLS